eukprot:UN07513
MPLSSQSHNQGWEKPFTLPLKNIPLGFSQSSIEERTPDSITDDVVANEQCVPFVDSAPSEEEST